MTFFPFFLFLLLLVVVFFKSNVFIAGSVIGFLFLLYVLSRFWARRGAAALTVQRAFVDRSFAGEQVTVELIVENTGLLPIAWVEMEEIMPPSLGEAVFPVQVFSLGPHQTKRFSYTVACRRRGYYELGPLRAQTGDLFGFETRVAQLREASRLIVYPRVLPLKRLSLPTASALAALPTPSALFEDPTRIVGVREYTPRDSLRRVHWLASARTGTLQVKQYQRAIARDTLICLDLDLKGYELAQRNEAIERAIVVAASLAHHMIAQERLPAGLATDARDPLAGVVTRITIPPHAEWHHLIAILEVLARVEAASACPFAELLRREGTALSYGSTVVAIAGRLDEAVAAALLDLQRSGHAVTVILVQPPAVTTSPVPLGRIRVHRLWELDRTSSLTA